MCPVLRGLMRKVRVDCKVRARVIENMLTVISSILTANYVPLNRTKSFSLEGDRIIVQHEVIVGSQNNDDFCDILALSGLSRGLM